MIDKNSSIAFELEKETNTENDKNNVAYKIRTLMYKAFQIICNVCVCVCVCVCVREREREREA